jgi:hypothetical protein
MIIWYESGKKLFLLRHFSGIRRKGLRKTNTRSGYLQKTGTTCTVVWVLCLHSELCNNKIKVNVNLSLCFNWALRHEGELGEWMYSPIHSLTSALDGGEWSASHPGRFTPRERAPGTHWIGGWVGPRTCVDAVKFLFFDNMKLGLKSNVIVWEQILSWVSWHEAHYTDTFVSINLWSQLRQEVKTNRSLRQWQRLLSLLFIVYRE